jgi:outer membrane protein OmpA-like peptidoglycan-associated protein
MHSRGLVSKRRGRDEAEKPFWISFADLMTSLMVLFLVVMSVALLAITQKDSDREAAEGGRSNDISKMLTSLDRCAASFPGVKIHRERNAIDFGDQARFESASHRLSADQANLLRRFVPCVLKMAKLIPDKGWLKRVVAEGFADSRGTYLFNLDLSLKRSQRVLCVLLEPQSATSGGLSIEDKASIQELFLVGGYSFNSAKDSLEESRRIELRLEFYEVGEKPRSKSTGSQSEMGSCALGAGL